jgi:hypothetical protein
LPTGRRRSRSCAGSSSGRHRGLPQSRPSQGSCRIRSMYGPRGKTRTRCAWPPAARAIRGSGLRLTSAAVAPCMRRHPRAPMRPGSPDRRDEEPLVTAAALSTSMGCIRQAPGWRPGREWTGTSGSVHDHLNVRNLTRSRAPTAPGSLSRGSQTSGRRHAGAACHQLRRRPTRRRQSATKVASPTSAPTR